MNMTGSPQFDAERREGLTPTGGRRRPGAVPGCREADRSRVRRPSCRAWSTAGPRDRGARAVPCGSGRPPIERRGGRGLCARRRAASCRRARGRTVPGCRTRSWSKNGRVTRTALSPQLVESRRCRSKRSRPSTADAGFGAQRLTNDSPTGTAGVFSHTRDPVDRRGGRIPSASRTLRGFASAKHSGHHEDRRRSRPGRDRCSSVLPRTDDPHRTPTAGERRRPAGPASE